MASTGFILEFYLEAPPDIVMGLLSESELITDWSKAEAIIEKRVGGKVVLFDGWIEGKLLTITDSKLAYTWKPSNWPEEIPVSTVDFTLEAQGNGTRIVLEHTRFPNSKELEDHQSGWSDQFFDLIKIYLE